MAAPQNQGLQIALIVCAMFMVALAVTSFIFYNSSKDETLRARQRRQRRQEIGRTVAESRRGIEPTEAVDRVRRARRRRDDSGRLQKGRGDLRRDDARVGAKLSQHRQSIGDRAAKANRAGRRFRGTQRANCKAISKPRKRRSSPKSSNTKPASKKPRTIWSKSRQSSNADREKFKKEDAELVRKFEDTKKDLDDKIAKSSKDLDETETLLRNALGRTMP